MISFEKIGGASGAFFFVIKIKPQGEVFKHPPVGRGLKGSSTKS